MASEITTNLTLKVTKGYLDITRSIASAWTLATAKPNVAGMTQAIGFAAHEAINLGDVGAATLGWAWFRNLDTTNYVEIGIDFGPGTFGPLIRLNAGEACVIRLSAACAPYAQANTAAVVLEKVIFDT